MKWKSYVEFLFLCHRGVLSLTFSFSPYFQSHIRVHRHHGLSILPVQSGGRIWVPVLRVHRPIPGQEIPVGINKIINGEIVFPIKESCPSADYLLEFNHGIDWPQEYNVSDIPGIYTRG